MYNFWIWGHVTDNKQILSYLPKGTKRFPLSQVNSDNMDDVVFQEWMNLHNMSHRLTGDRSITVTVQIKIIINTQALEKQHGWTFPVSDLHQLSLWLTRWRVYWIRRQHFLNALHFSTFQTPVGVESEQSPSQNISPIWEFAFSPVSSFWWSVTCLCNRVTLLNLT